MKEAVSYAGIGRQRHKLNILMLWFVVTRSMGRCDGLLLLTAYKDAMVCCYWQHIKMRWFVVTGSMGRCDGLLLLAAYKDAMVCCYWQHGKMCKPQMGALFQDKLAD
jgi:hypothetical protein